MHLPRRPIHRPAAEHMQMQMEYRLARLRTPISNYAVAVVADPFGCRDLVAGQTQPPEQLGIILAGLGETRDVPLRNHQDMHRSLRIGVLEGEADVILIDDGCLDFLVGDLAEYAVGQAAHLRNAFQWARRPPRPGRAGPLYQQHGDFARVEPQRHSSAVLGLAQRNRTSAGLELASGGLRCFSMRCAVAGAMKRRRRRTEVNSGSRLHAQTDRQAPELACPHQALTGQAVR